MSAAFKPPEDQSERECAVCTFDRNVIVTAGAGTGKTTLLVDRLIHLLMREPEPLAITEIVALTFTNKAANEMKLRLGEALEALRHAEDLPEKAAVLMDRYTLSRRDIDVRAEAALRQLERAEIGTLHHFATSLLRRYPIEAGVDPQFRVDTGAQAAEHLFDECWSAWLEGELSAQSPNKTRWQAALRQFSLGELRETAGALASETVDIDDLKKQIDEARPPKTVAQWLRGLIAATDLLLEGHPDTLGNGASTRSRNVEKMIAAAKAVFESVLASGEVGDAASGEDAAGYALLASGKQAAKVKGWTDEDIEAAKGLIRIAQGLLRIDAAALENLLALLGPFVRRLRKIQTKQAWVSFDGLLVRARNLLRDCPGVREALKARYRAILIDEFQDTDPVQYEILLYLSEGPAERPDRSAKNWREVRLAPGKLFVVGDPKQSIYGFRRADIAATQAIRQTILDQGGIECRLTTNFRSHTALLEPVNGIFRKLMLPKDGLQPDYIGIHSAAKVETLEAEAGPNLFRAVVCRFVDTLGEDRRTGSGAEPMKAEEARRAEGEALARWLSETVIGKAIIHDRDGAARRVRRGDVAILMRRLTGVHFYLEPLRRWGIRYVVEGERRFYRSQEVRDAVNLLCAVADPNDRMALVGVLRSPVGGLPDTDILRLHREGRLHYRKAKDDAELAPTLRALYGMLDRLHALAFRLPVGAAVTRIFDETGIALLAASATHREQALANLEKIRRDAELLGLEATGTFREVAAALAQAVSEGREAAESPLAEAGVDAVKVFSIHKAKGLEFPVVVLAGSHAGSDHPPQGRVLARHDWFSGLSGLRVGEVSDLASVYLAEKERLREIEEEKRVLYVAMTRAREHLSFFGAGRFRRGSFFSLLAEGTGHSFSDAAAESLTVGKGTIEIQNLSIDMNHLHRKAAEKKNTPKVDWGDWAAQWALRKKSCEAIEGRRLFINPSVLKRMDAPALLKEMKAAAPAPSSGLGGEAAERGKWIGRLAHLFLEGWDFSKPVEGLGEILTGFVKAQVPPMEGFSGEEMASELGAIFDTFLKSPVYRRLSGAKILGREIPFVMPWEGQVMEGVIDIAYESEGALYVGDYKTDRVSHADLAQAAEKYRHQCIVYPEALRRALKRDVAAMELIFLRLGESVSVITPPPLTKGD